MLILLCAVWGLTFPATRAALQVTHPMHFLALRFGVAALLLAPTAISRSRGAIRRSWRWGVMVGLLLLAGFTLQVYGLAWTTASRSGFLTGLLVVIAPLLAVVFGTSRAGIGCWLGILPALVGIYLMSDPTLGGLNRGDWLTIGCAVAFAAQMVALEAAVRRGADVWALVHIQIWVVFVGAAVWSLLQGFKPTLTATGWLAVLYTGLFGGVAATWLQTRFQPDVTAGHAALVFTLEPVFAGLFAWLLLGEVWTGRGLVGAGFILMGMAVSASSEMRAVSTQ